MVHHYPKYNEFRYLVTYIEYIPRHQWADWLQRATLLWIKQNGINLESISEFEMDFRGTVRVFPQDFDGDGQDEWVLVNERDTVYVVIAQEGDGYRLVNLPLRVSGQAGSPNRGIGYYHPEPRFEDVNADGLPEMILSYGGFLIADHQTHGNLDIYLWKAGAPDLILSLPYQEAYTGSNCVPEPCHPPWIFKNMDDDSALENSYYRGENVFPCLYDWNGVEYENAHPDDLSCSALAGIAGSIVVHDTLPDESSDEQVIGYNYRHALEAFQAEDYEAVLKLTETALNRIDGNDLPSLELQTRYLRGLAFEALSRPDKAKVEYIAALQGSISNLDLDAEYLYINGENPLPFEWVWYPLASLHLKIDPPLQLPQIVPG